jgi:hypothetical protein
MAEFELKSASAPLKRSAFRSVAGGKF